MAIRLSCGVFLVAPDSDGKLRLCVIQKKHTYAMVDLVCGNYTPETATRLVNMCSVREQALFHSYDAMHFDVWGEVGSRATYNKGRVLYETCAIDTIQIVSSRQPIFEIPKGRPNTRESPLKCALREHHEETGITNEQYDLVDPAKYMTYYFSDGGNRYKYIYYLAYADAPIESSLSSHEVGCVRWVSLEDMQTLTGNSQFPIYRWARNRIKDAMCVRFWALCVC